MVPVPESGRSRSMRVLDTAPWNGSAKQKGIAMKHPPRPLASRVDGGLAAVTPAACGSSTTAGQASASSPAAAAPSPATASPAAVPASSIAPRRRQSRALTATAANFMVSAVGEPEEMYTEGQVQSMHPTSGEAMVAER